MEIPIRDATKNVGLAYNYNTIKLFKKLNYPIMEDVSIHNELLKNKDFLNKYETVILLHNEYVTRELFDAITTHRPLA